MDVDKSTIDSFELGPPDWLRARAQNIGRSSSGREDSRQAGGASDSNPGRTRGDQATRCPGSGYWLPMPAEVDMLARYKPECPWQ